MNARKLLLARAEGTRTIHPFEPKPRWHPVETVLRHFTAIAPITLNNIPQPAGPLHYEVFERETQQTHRFQTEAEMHQWLGDRGGPKIPGEGQRLKAFSMQK
ncbi:MAG: hypothetical protein AAGD09_15080 [Cyanobacteria bacterium P01_F01_bin.56]